MQKKMNLSNQIMTNQLAYAEATSRGIECTFPGFGDLIFMNYKGKSWYTLGSKSSIQSSIGMSIADKKPFAKKILKKNNIPTSKYCTGKRDDVLKKLESFEFPIVMKPIDGREGQDVHIGIKNIENAINFLDKSNKIMMFEEMLIGNEARVLCIDYKFVAATKRNPAFVTGNGKDKIDELIKEKNSHQWRGDDGSFPLSKIIIDEALISNLEEQNLSIDSIPAQNQYVYLRKTSNLSAGGEPENVTDAVCKENIFLFEKIARIADLNVIGIDVMCQDLSKPIINQPKAGIIEINAAPGFRMHHYPLTGKPIDVTSKFINMILKAYGLD